MAAFIILIAILALLWVWIQRRKPSRSSYDDSILSDSAYDSHYNGPTVTTHDSPVVSGGGDLGGAGASGSWDSGGGDSGGGDGGSGD